MVFLQQRSHAIDSLLKADASSLAGVTEAQLAAAPGIDASASSCLRCHCKFGAPHPFANIPLHEYRLA